MPSFHTVENNCGRMRSKANMKLSLKFFTSKKLFNFAFTFIETFGLSLIIADFFTYLCCGKGSNWS